MPITTTGKLFMQNTDGSYSPLSDIPTLSFDDIEPYVSETISLSPCSMTFTYTISNHNKSKLRKIALGWRRKAPLRFRMLLRAMKLKGV